MSNEEGIHSSKCTRNNSKIAIPTSNFHLKNVRKSQESTHLHYIQHYNYSQPAPKTSFMILTTKASQYHTPSTPAPTVIIEPSSSLITHIQCLDRRAPHDPLISVEIKHTERQPIHFSPSCPTILPTPATRKQETRRLQCKMMQI